VFLLPFLNVLSLLFGYLLIYQSLIKLD